MWRNSRLHDDAISFRATASARSLRKAELAAENAKRRKRVVKPLPLVVVVVRRLSRVHRLLTQKGCAVPRRRPFSRALSPIERVSEVLLRDRDKRVARENRTRRLSDGKVRQQHSKRSLRFALPSRPRARVSPTRRVDELANCQRGFGGNAAREAYKRSKQRARQERGRRAQRRGLRTQLCEIGRRHEVTGHNRSDKRVPIKCYPRGIPYGIGPFSNPQSPIAISRPKPYVPSRSHVNAGCRCRCHRHFPPLFRRTRRWTTTVTVMVV